MSGAGQTLIANGGTLNVSGPVSLGRLITNQSGGTLNLTGTGQINTTAAITVLDNQAGALVNIQNDNGFTGDGGANEAITNAGTFRKSAGTGTSTVSLIDLNNTGGALDIQSGQLTLSGAFNHTGTSSVTAGTVNAAGGGSSSGSLALSSGVLLNLTGGTDTLATGSSITGAGTYQVNGGTLTIGTVATDTASVTGRLDVVAGTLSGPGT